MRAIAFDSVGHHMVTSGADGDVKVFDVRTFKMLHRYFSHAPATSLEVSQRGLLSVSYGTRVQARVLPRALLPDCHLFEEGTRVRQYYTTSERQGGRNCEPRWRTQYSYEQATAPGLCASSFTSPPTSGMQVWKDCLSRKAHSPYMNHTAPGAVCGVRFVPYEVSSLSVFRMVQHKVFVDDEELGPDTGSCL